MNVIVAVSALLLGIWPRTAIAEDASSQVASSAQCELVLAIWTQFWNEAPRRSFASTPRVRDPLACAWNASASDRTPASFSVPAFSDRGATAFIQVGRDYGAHGESYHCTLVLIGDYWRVRECALVGTS